LYNTWTHQCADLPGNGASKINTPDSQSTCNGSSRDNQLWIMKHTRTIKGVELYELVNKKSSLCLDPPFYGADPAGTQLYIYDCNANPANDNQEWWFRDVTGNRDYEIVNYASNLCLDVADWASNGTDLARGLPLTLYFCHNSTWANGGWDDHVWDFVR
jgi:hypothetical protein